MIISICVVAHNEEKYLPMLFEDFCNQTYNHSLIEIILVDSMSTDKTNLLMNEFKKNRENDFNSITIIKNFKKKLSSGWNKAIDKFKGDAMIRIDAHASIPSNFIEKNVECLNSGEKVSGGKRINIISGNSNWKKTLLVLENSLFGSGIAPYRAGTNRKKYVKSLFHAMYMREVFQNVGRFNECLGRTEDNDWNYRVREKGYNLCFDHNIVSYQYTRNSLINMIKQKYGNGYWIGLTMGISPKCFSLFHFVPLFFVLYIFATGILYILGYKFFLLFIFVIYILLTMIIMLISFIREKYNLFLLFLPIIFFILHLSYGIGTLIGLIKMPFFKKNNKDKNNVF